MTKEKKADENSLSGKDLGNNEPEKLFRVLVTDHKDMSSILDTFSDEFNSINRSVPVSMRALNDRIVEGFKLKDEFISGHNLHDITEFEVSEDKIIVIKELGRILRGINDSVGAFHLLPRGFLFLMVSQFDALIANIMKYILHHRPGSLSQDKTFTLNQIIELGSIDNVKEEAINREVDAEMRKSHSDHLEWIEKRTGLKSLKDLASWKQVIELTERRNLYAHTNGFVSKQYLNVCKEWNIEVPKGVVLGQQIPFSPNYIVQAYRCAYQFAHILGHMVWRKITPSQHSTADNHFVDCVYGLMTERKFTIASSLLETALETPKWFLSEKDHMISLVNLAICKKNTKQVGEAKKIVSIDWSGRGAEFRLAQAVIQEDNELALRLMKEIGAGETPGKIGYQEWPLFYGFRNRDDFKEMYKLIFGEDYMKDTDQRNFRNLKDEGKSALAEASEVSRSVSDDNGAEDSDSVEGTNCAEESDSAYDGNSVKDGMGEVANVGDMDSSPNTEQPHSYH